MKIAICSKIDFKPESGDRKSHAILAAGFENLELTPIEVAEEINLGHVYSAYHTPPRRKENFICSGMLSVDLDRGWTLEELLADDYVKGYASIVYTTASHTPEAPRLRVLFELERDITVAAEMARAYRGIILRFKGDPACSTPCQMFYGSKGSNPIVLGQVLPNEQLDHLILLGIDAADEPDASGNSQKEKIDEVKRQTQTPRSAIRLKPSQQLRVDGGQYQFIDDIEVKTNVHCPEHTDKHASAFVVANRKGVKGVHCRTCRQTFWPESHTRAELLEYDFYEFESRIDELEFDDDPAFNLDDEAPPEYWSNDFRAVQRRNEKYLSQFPLEEGVILVRSPKGSGKSEQLKSIVTQCKDKGWSVMLVGHRQLLLSQMAVALGLHYYKDKISADEDRYEIFRYLAICADSVPYKLNTMAHHFDVVIIDESEQMLAHLTSKTLRDNRRQCYLKLEFYVREARTVIACDADLSSMTFDTIERMRQGVNRTRLYTNSHEVEGAVIDLYDSELHLMGELAAAVTEGGLHYVACNSKDKAKVIKKKLIADGVPAERIMLITSDNSQTAEIRKFLADIKSNILNYSVLIASPSLGTGIDITFSETPWLVNSEGVVTVNTAKVIFQKVDTVFGFFDSMINTHFDIDQQLARVRHPKAVKVWITPQKFYSECEPAVIMENCVTSGEASDSLSGYDKEGRAIYDADDKILMLFANVMMLTNASKNNLKKHFVDLKRRNGWTVNEVAAIDNGYEETKQSVKEAKKELAMEYVQEICDAAIYSEMEYIKIRAKQMPSREEFCALQRYRINHFYGQDVTPALVALDDKGKYRSQIYMLVRFISKDVVMIDRDYSQAERLSIDRDNNFAKKELLHKLIGATGLLNEQKEFIPHKEISSTDLKPFSTACIQNQPSLERLFNIPLRADLLKKPLMQLNQILKLIGMKTNQVRKIDVDANKRIFIHALDMQLHDQAMEYALAKVRTQTSPLETNLDEESGSLVIRYKNSKKIVKRFS
jgi:hypothetical protein